jgi:hypothetical protein
MSNETEIAQARMQMQRTLRAINREVINGVVPDLDVDRLKPFFTLVAKARALYIQKLMEIAGGGSDMPSDAQVKELSLLRRSYDELLSGGQMIETAIERGYIDVKGMGGSKR